MKGASQHERRHLQVMAIAVCLIAAAVNPHASAAKKKERPKAPPLKSITVIPEGATLYGARATQRVVVMGTFKDGSVKDVTAQAQFRSSNPKVAAVSKDGLITPVADGSAIITAKVKRLTANAKVTVKNIADDSIHFLNDILPVISKAGCNQTGCHGSPKGKAGFKLSLFGAEPPWDYEMLSKSAFARRVNRVEPAKSLFLLKATAVVSHGGGKRLEPGSPDYNLLAQWVAQGMPWGDEKAPKLTGIEVFPKEWTLQKDESQQLLVTAKFSDGTTRDVTRLASYKSNEEPIASVSGDGKVTAQSFGEAVIIIGYGGQFVTSRIAVPQPLPVPFPEVAANNKIDELVFAKLKKLGIPPSEVCTDEEFIRRASLDVIGTLPTPEEVRKFLADSDPNKRSKLIDSILEREEFADFWALKWGDLLRVKPEFPIHLWSKGVAAFHNWIRQSIAQNKPYDKFVREMLTANGSGYRNGPSNYYRAAPSRDPQTWAEMTSTTFLGIRIDCAHCHAHPFEAWTHEDNFGLAAFFKVGLKGTGEWGEEIVFFNPGSVVRHTRTGEVVKPKFLGGEVLDLKPNEDPRQKLAEWLTSPQNPWFTKNIVNRIWYWLLGRGIVHEPDDFRITNPPENPELLDYLAQELITHNYDLKHIFRLILNSKTYQLSSKPNDWNKTDITHFSHYYIKRLSAEQLLDAISLACEAPEKFPGLPLGYRAIQLPHSQVGSYFLDLFGRPPRDITCECERKQEIAMPQALYLINTDHLERKLRDGQRIKRLIAAGKSDAEAIEELYLAALARFPNDEEKQKALEYVSGKKEAREQALQDLLWALLNTKEFMFNH